MSFLIADAMAQTAAQPAPPPDSGMSMIIMMVGMFVFMSSLNKGDEVVLTCGMLGRIVRIEGDYMVLNTGENIELRFQRQAVHAVLPKGTIKAI